MVWGPQVNKDVVGLLSLPVEDHLAYDVASADFAEFDSVKQEYSNLEGEGEIDTFFESEFL